MPSFDIVSQVDAQELTNAIHQANKEVATRYDFKGADAKFTQSDNGIALEADSKLQLGQMKDILYNKCAKRGVDLGALKPDQPREQGKRAMQRVAVCQGIATELGKKIAKRVKQDKFKAQTAIQSTQVRVTGKKRDELQAIIAMLEAEDFGQPLQFVNFRD